MNDRSTSWTRYAPTPSAGPSLPSVVPAGLRPRYPVEAAEAGGIFGRSRAVPRQRRGWPGTQVNSGRVSGHELNPDLIGRRWFVDAIQMRRTCDAIAAGWHATLSSLLTARWSWAPGDPDDGLSREIADRQTAMWERLHRPWSRALKQMLLYLPDGVRCGEPLWGIGPTGQIDVIDAWGDIEPVSHDRWIFDDRGQWCGLQQRPPTGDAAYVSGSGTIIPADELVYLGHGVEGSDLNGCGLLRPLWARWRQRVDVIDLTMEALRRWAFPTPVANVDETAAREASLTPAAREARIAEVERTFEGFAVGDLASLRSSSIVRLDTFGGDVDLSRSIPLMDHLDSALLRGFLLQLLTLGTTSTGSRSVGEVHQGIWRDSLLVPLDDVSEAYSGVPRPGGGVGAKWVELNYGVVHPDRLARLEHSGLSVDPLVDLVERLDAAKLAMFDIGSTRSDKAAMRRRMGLDPLPEPEDVTDEDIGIDPADDDGEPDLPFRDGIYDASNREAADLLGISTAALNRRVRKSLAVGLDVPAIGSGRDRRWALGRVQAWWHELSGRGKA